jgi:uncharacterized protein (TIGR02996 family)
MTPDDAFFSAIIESPGDDGPRLVYADGLEDHGQPGRAEFIRVQVARARNLEVYPGGVELEARERELLREHGGEWAGPLRGLVHDLEFRRGFVESITARPEAFLEHADALFWAAPIRQVTFQTVMFQLARPHLVFLSAGAVLPRLASCPHLARLRAISFAHNRIGDAGVEALAASPHLARLTSLDLTGNDVGDRGVEALAASPSFSRLTSLKLGSNRVGPAGARALAASPHVTRLASLDLGENPLGDDAVRALAASGNMCGLATLGLAGCGLGTAGARALAASPNLAGLRSLDVRDNAIGNKAREALRLRFGKGRCRF